MPQMKKRCRIPASLSELGVKEQDIPVLATNALKDACGLTNPRKATQDDIDQRVEQLAERHQRSPSEVWLQLEKSGQLEVLEREITEDKVFQHLVAQSTVA